MGSLGTGHSAHEVWMTRTDSMGLRSLARERDMLGYNVVGGYSAWTMSTEQYFYVCSMYSGVVHGCF